MTAKNPSPDTQQMLPFTKINIMMPGARISFLIENQGKKEMGNGNKNQTRGKYGINKMIVRPVYSFRYFVKDDYGIDRER